MEILGKLFGSEARVRLLRLFFLNPDDAFEMKSIAKRTKTSRASARRELSLFNSSGVIKRHQFFKELPKKKGRRHRSKKKVEGWILDKSFPYAIPLQNLLVSADLIKKEDVLKRFQGAGKIKLLIIAGIFLKEDNSPVDVLVVGDKLRRGAIEKVLHRLEAEMGKELRYSLLNVAEFRYRMEVYDKFVRDILEYPHETVIDRLGVENR